MLAPLSNVIKAHHFASSFHFPSLSPMSAFADRFSDRPFCVCVCVHVRACVVAFLSVCVCGMDDRCPRTFCTHFLYPLGHAPSDVPGMLPYRADT